jgi:GNAT superfamily N-acetyltransferase
MKLICVPPERAGEFLPLAARFIDAAMARGGLSDADGVHDDVRAGTSLLWLAVDAEARIVGAGVTKLMMSRGAKICFIVAWGCDDHARCAHLLAAIEDFARAEGCVAVRLEGRPGWARALRDHYRTKAVILEKVL